MKVFSGVLFLCVATFASAQNSEKPEDLSELLQPILKKSSVPSLATMAIVDGEVKGSGAVGVRVKGESDPVTVDDKFHIGSCTKSMTATLAAVLIEEGKLSWDLTVKEALPRYRMHEAYENVTLRQLLSNRGGFPKDVPRDIWSDAWKASGKGQVQRAAFAKAMLQLDPVYPPGEGHEYSNTGFAVAGHMMEILMKKSWGTLLKEKVFDPLGMSSAGFGAPNNDRVNPQPWGHSKDSKPIPRGKGSDNPAAIGPAGTVHCSLPDLAKYVRMHTLRELGPVLKKQSSYDVLHHPMNADHGYAKGWIVTERGWGGQVFTHTGSNTMFYCTIWFSPEKKFAGIAATNQGDAHAVCDEVIGALIGRYLR
ncbi:MAG: beta-lactamase family protein [Verrucomicrobiales bacterium]|nr:beta-lactamase family protein [Verrucomicrobiales bacterium]